jgi:membrane-associated phospholipid phosphatase
MWAGIHFPSDVEAGRAIGEAVAKQAVVLASDVPMK